MKSEKPVHAPQAEQPIREVNSPAVKTMNPEVLEPEPLKARVPTARKVKGAAQIAGGAVLAAVGVPMCVLPGPGVAAIAGGAALVSKGQRNFSGREATAAEAKLDAAAEKLGAVAKEQAGKAVRKAVKEAPVVAGKAARGVARGMGAAAKVGGKLVSKGIHAGASKRGARKAKR